MFEAFKKIKIKGGCFENETELELFKKMRHFNNKSQQYKTEKTQNIEGTEKPLKIGRLLDY